MSESILVIDGTIQVEVLEVGSPVGPPGPPGAAGAEGPSGEPGLDGDDGVGLPPGGTTGQVPKKASATNFDIVWGDEASAVLESVAGGAGFIDVSGSVTLDLDTGRNFHNTMVGSITALAFSNIPTPTETAAAWTWVLAIDPTGGYTLSGTPTVTWVDGGSWASLNMAANAVNIVTFWRVGGVTYAAIVTNGRLQLDDLFYHFLSAETLSIVVRTPVVMDLANAQVNGAGTVTYQKNSTTITSATSVADRTFAASDMFRVTAEAGQSVTVPRYAP